MTLLSRPFAEAFARDWMMAWNDRDTDRILSFFSDEIVFHSPRIAELTGSRTASLIGKQALRDHWSRALATAPQLFFELDDVLTGSDCITVLYTNHREQLVAETFIFGPDGQITEAIATYR